MACSAINAESPSVWLYSYLVTFKFTLVMQVRSMYRFTCIFVTLQLSFDEDLQSSGLNVQCMHASINILHCFNTFSGVMALTLPYSAAVSYALSVPWFCQGQEPSRNLSCKEPWPPKQRELVFSSSHSGNINKSAQSNVGQNISRRTSNERGPMGGSKELALQVGLK